MRVPLLFRLPVFGALLVASSCGDDGLADLELQAAGVYELKWVNGEPPPYPVGEQEAHLVSVLSGRITLRADRTCEYGHAFDLYSLEDFSTRREVESEPCTWSIGNGAVHLRFAEAGYISGIFSRDALWFDYLFNESLRFVYERNLQN